MDEGALVIVPDPTNTDTFQVVVLDESKVGERLTRWLNEHEKTLWGEGLHGRKLTWPSHTSIRADARVLHLHALMMLFYRRRINPEVWEKDITKFPVGMWDRDDRWIRRSALVALVEKIGEIGPEGAFLKRRLASFDAEGNIREEETKKFAERVSKALGRQEYIDNFCSGSPFEILGEGDDSDTSDLTKDTDEDTDTSGWNEYEAE
ncbi:hypothetical protein BU23DRAFT_635789 [Bimuria novae-zelandiae CBS 107.79]|uniref:Uncharacterized protein n=1 Tax=Bimuria novae-zelandiae CBS 107.79 TaxID=1447943 RepID=A0A6A5VES4_9PLEO|nr:hypothetical protein BU23DRAFT_635789 [Bimuria novae-zelandiae CBS 107.79]